MGTRVAVVLAVLAFAGIARAEDPYPRALPARPLILPDGIFEVAADLALRTEDTSTPTSAGDIVGLVDFDPGVRIGAPGVELAADVALGLAEDVSNSGMTSHDTFGALHLAARHGFCPDYAVGAELTVLRPSSDARTLAPRLTSAMKRRFNGGRTAIELLAAVGLDQLSGDPDVTTLIAGGELRVQAQWSPTSAIEAHASLAINRRLHADGSDPLAHVAPATFSSGEVGILWLWALGPTFDLVLGGDVTTSQPEETSFTIGLRVRRIP